MKKKTIISWSSGKDSAFALYKVLQSEKYEVVGLLTTITAEYERISMHGVRKELLEIQAELIGLPLYIVEINPGCTDNDYRAVMKKQLEAFKQMGVDCIVFGDIFLSEIRSFREDNMKGTGIEAIFPLWKINTSELGREFIHSGFKSILTCVDTEKLDKSFVGKEYDHNFLRKLPIEVDPCGENGEFHSFVYDGPIFKHPINLCKGELVLRDNRFMYCDILRR